MTEIVIPTRVSEIAEWRKYPTVVIDQWDALKCAKPCNNTPEGSGFEYAPNDPAKANLPAGADLDGIYVCAKCGAVIDIKPVPEWDPAREAAEERRALGQALINRDRN
ncbi:hypothetical protein [Nonomuraea sp. JJY05]|uniref:hypothetical protein n=1 Tax=Nonomuraea sp. JJY05 TaxID=3350255 RepID=UPI00373E2CEC